VNESILGGLMLKAEIATKDRLMEEGINNSSYLAFSFQKPVTVKGWSVSSKPITVQLFSIFYLSIFFFSGPDTQDILILS
jgi:hypothetical protein